MHPTKNGTRTVTSVENVFEILEAIQRHNGARVSELAEDLDLAKSTIHRYLVTLREKEYVVKEGDEYNLGLRFMHLGQSARKRKAAYDLAQSKVEELADETEERVVFIVEEHGQAAYVHRATGKRAIQIDPGPGKRIPLHATAGGKAILAELPAERVETIVNRRGLPAITENTITTEAELHEELESIRQRGFSFNKEEYVTGLHSVSVPVCPYDRILGSITITGPAKRMEGERLESELPDLLLGSINELEVNIVGTDWTME